MEGTGGDAATEVELVGSRISFYSAVRLTDLTVAHSVCSLRLW